MNDYTTDCQIGQYFCESCERSFDEPSEIKYRETYYGEFSQLFVEHYCPYCGSDDIKLKEFW